MPEIHASRRAAVQRQVAALDADAALITSGVNVRYLTGLASSNSALLLLAGGQAVLATDSRYAGTASRDCADTELLVDQFIEPALVKLARSRGVSRLAFEAQQMTVERHQALAELEPRDMAWLPLGRVVEELRMIKDESEIDLLARACAITGEAFSAMVDWLRPGVTERGFAVLLERAMIDLGAEAPAFNTIVASGPNGAIPHHSPGGRKFATGDLITIDCGARVGGYHADMTRTVAIGRPADWQREIYQLVEVAQAAGVAAARTGAAVADVDAVAREMISDAGHGAHFSHGLGHGVGLEIHEAPSIGHQKTGKLLDRVPITIEPGIYLPGEGGVRIEDTLVVRAGTGAAAGPAELLTTITRELLVL
jgi:Xaa-Pro aminopeptidase